MGSDTSGPGAGAGGGTPLANFADLNSFGGGSGGGGGIPASGTELCFSPWGNDEGEDDVGPVRHDLLWWQERTLCLATGRFKRAWVVESLRQLGF